VFLGPFLSWGYTIRLAEDGPPPPDDFATLLERREIIASYYTCEGRWAPPSADRLTKVKRPPSKIDLPSLSKTRP